MSHTHTTFNFQEMFDLPHTELNKRTKAALDEFVLALRTGEHIAEKGRVYQAYEAERTKRMANMRNNTHTTGAANQAEV